MNQSGCITNIAKALVAAQGEIKSVPKDSVNPHFKNRYASLETITETIRPILTRHGLALVQGGGIPTSNEHGAVTAISVESLLVHTSGEWIGSSVTMPLDKATPQGVGSAVSYGRRYGLCSLLAITTDEDDDGNAASAPKKAAPRPATDGQITQLIELARKTDDSAAIEVRLQKPLTQEKAGEWIAKLTAKAAQKQGNT